MASFSAANRKEILQQLKHESFDLIVIGGGITGAGILLDATSRGLKCALIEMQDYAAGTSSRSTKLVHGGLRYLKQLEIQLVREVGLERAIVYNNAMHLTRPYKMLLPLVKGGSIGSIGAYIGMWVYDFLANVKKKERRRILSKEQLCTLEPMIQSDGLKAGVEYYEYRTDDSRLTLEVIKEAVNRGAVAINYTKAESFIYTNDNISGVVIKDQIMNETINIKADYVINAAGPWVDEVDRLNDTKAKTKILHTKGVHIVVDQTKLPFKHAVYFDAGKGRMIFAIPREGKVYIGTTDTLYTENLIHPTILREDIAYIISAINQAFSSANIKAEDVESAWSGIRPLIRQEGKGPTEVSRKDEIFTYPSGLISIAGGKLTGYRMMAKRVVDVVCKRIQRIKNVYTPECTTDQIKLAGGKFDSELDYLHKISQYKLLGGKMGLNSEIATKWTARYGTNTPTLINIFSSTKHIFPNALPRHIACEIYYCVHNEMCQSPLDFIIRRTSMIYFDIKTIRQHYDAIAQYMSTLLPHPNTTAWEAEYQSIITALESAKSQA